MHKSATEYGRLCCGLCCTAVTATGMLGKLYFARGGLALFVRQMQIDTAEGPMHTHTAQIGP